MAVRRPLVVSAWLLWALVTAVLYALPLDRVTTDAVSNGSFVIGAVGIVAATTAAARSVAGVDRLAWAAIGITTAIAVTVFAFDPAGSQRAPSVALYLAPAVALAVLTTIVLFGRHPLSGLGLARVLFDGAWLTSGLLAALWSVAIGPLPDLVGSRLPFLLLACFPVIAIAGGVITTILLPYAVGPCRWSLAALGGGAAVTAVAGGIHVRLAATGALDFGTWYDYGWTVGIGLVGLATLDPGMGQRWRPAHPGVRFQQAVTIGPLVLVVPPTLVGGWDAIPSPLTLTMLALLAVRVLLVMAENGRLTARLHHRANHDELTGLANRRGLGEVFAGTGGGAATRTTVLYLDLDDFKLVNDRHGHAAGDQVLAEVGRRLRLATRAGDHVGRLGGDEFVVITATADSWKFAERLQRAVSRPIDWQDTTLVVGCSIGFATARGGPTRNLLERADGALYDAKAAGGSRIREAGEGPQVSTAATGDGLGSPDRGEGRPEP